MKIVLHQGLSEQEFYGELLYEFKVFTSKTDFSDQFRKVMIRFKHIFYNLNVMRQSACLVSYPIIVDIFAALFLLHAGGLGVRLYDGPDLK